MSKGYIVAQLFTARQARPITNATVIISRPGTGGESIIRTVEVDREGKNGTDRSRYASQITFFGRNI